MTPTQFPHVRVLRDELTPDQIVGMWFATAQGMRGFVRYRLDTIVYSVTLYQDGKESERLFGINWMRGARYFETREECFAPGLEAFERGATMVAT